MNGKVMGSLERMTALAGALGVAPQSLVPIIDRLPQSGAGAPGSGLRSARDRRPWKHGFPPGLADYLDKRGRGVSWDVVQALAGDTLAHHLDLIPDEAFWDRRRKAAEREIGLRDAAYKAQRAPEAPPPTPEPQPAPAPRGEQSASDPAPPSESPAT